jgi:hypothetical protein
MRIKAPFTIHVSNSGQYWLISALRGRFARKVVMILDHARICHTPRLSCMHLHHPEAKAVH